MTKLEKLDFIQFTTLFAFECSEHGVKCYMSLFPNYNQVELKVIDQSGFDFFQEFYLDGDYDEELGIYRKWSNKIRKELNMK